MKHKFNDPTESREALHYWNTLLYWDTVLNCQQSGSWGADEFWDEVQVESWPKFTNRCASHIPFAWVEDVKQLILQAKKELGDKIDFTQIKEKFCMLTIYKQCEDEQTAARFRELELECIERLIKKGVHPPRQELSNG